MIDKEIRTGESNTHAKRLKGGPLTPEDIPGFYEAADREMHPERYADPKVVAWFNRIWRERLERRRTR